MIWLLGTALAADFESLVAPIDPQRAARMSAEGGSWRPGCPVPLADLRLVTVTHVGFDGAIRRGALVLHHDAVEAVLSALEAAYAVGFPIENMAPVEAYGGSDDASMSANNTSAFNCRRIGSGGTWSQHAYGRAIDINPRVNPYVSGVRVQPPEGEAFVDRTAPATGLIADDSPLVQAFRVAGWTWGGSWRSSKDYQHFSASGR